jgi:MOSC domain-containing protein YiiM
VTVPTIVSVNVGTAKPLAGKSGVSAIDKRGVLGRVAVGFLGVHGDEQSDKQSHGGVEQAVYAYATEDLADWAANLGRDLAPGHFGENLSTRGVDVTGALIGEKWRIGTTVLQVSRPRIPCVVFQNWMTEPQWVKRFTQAGKPGAYLRVLTEGELGVGDEVVVLDRPAHNVTVGLVFRALTTDRDLMSQLRDVDELPRDIRELARRSVGSS